MAEIRLVGLNNKGVLAPPAATDNALVSKLAVGTTSSFSVLQKADIDNLLTLTSGIDAGALHNHDARYFVRTELTSNTLNATGADKLSASNPFGGFATIQQVIQALYNQIATSSLGEWQNSVRDKDTISPPLAPSVGDRYLVGTNVVGSASGAWAGHDGQIAEWTGTTWQFTQGSVGMFVTADDEITVMYYFNGSSWEPRSFEATTASGFLQLTAGDIALRNLNKWNLIVGNDSNVAVALDTDAVGDILVDATTGLTYKEEHIKDIHIAGDAAIASSKLEAGLPSQLIVYDAAGRAVVQTVTGDIAVSSAAAFTIKPLAVKSAMIDWGSGVGQIDDTDIPVNYASTAYTGGTTLRDEFTGINAALAAIQTTNTNQTAEDLTFLKLDGTRSMTGALNMNNQNIIGVPTARIDVITDKASNAAFTLSTATQIGADRKIVFTGTAKKIENLADGSALTDAATFGQLSSAQTTLTNSINTKVSKAGDTMTGALAMTNNKITALAAGTVSTDAVNFGQLDTQNTNLTNSINTKVSKAGDTMTGALNMGTTNKITNLAAGTVSTDAVNKGQLDAVDTARINGDALKVNKAGDSMTGALAMGTNKITGLADGTLTADAVNFGQLSTQNTNLTNSINTKVSKAGDTMSGALNMGGTNKIVSLANGTVSTDAATYGQVTAVDTAKVNRAGDTMSGALAMSNNKITGLANGTVAADAVNYGQLQAAISSASGDAALKVNKAGDTMTGALAMSNNKITSLAAGTAATDAVNKGQLDLKIDLTEKGAANGVATLGSDGKIPTAQLPALAITDTFVVATQAAMLALTAQTGDVAVRTDLNKSFILRGSSSSTLADWQELLTPTDLVLSVNNKTGAVTLTTTDIAEGTNLYYTQARFDSAFGGKSTTNLTEGTNLYYTQARFDSAFTAKSTTNLAEGTNLYYTQARFDSALAAKSTTNVAEGTNLYFTDTRAKTAAVVNSTAGTQTDQAASVAAMKTYVTGLNATQDTAIAGKVSKSGDSMTGALAMGSNKITGLANGTATGDAVNYDQLILKLDASQKNAANGVAPLDASSRVPSANMALDAYTKVYQVADITARNALVAKESDIARVANNGSGLPESYTYTGSAWISIGGAGSVTSVNTLTGAVVLTTDNINEGTTNRYYTQGRFDTSFAGKTTASLTESVNLYFTDARAKTAAVVNSMTGTQTDQAPSVAAVKSYISAGAVGFKNMVFTLTATDITNGYVNLLHTANNDSVLVYPKGGLPQVVGDDFTLSVVGGVTRVTLLSSFLSTLSAGDKLVVYYAYTP